MYASWSARGQDARTGCVRSSLAVRMERVTTTLVKFIELVRAARSSSVQPGASRAEPRKKICFLEIIALIALVSRSLTSQRTQQRKWLQMVPDMTSFIMSCVLVEVTVSVFVCVRCLGCTSLMQSLEPVWGNSQRGYYDLSFPNTSSQALSTKIAIWMELEAAGAAAATPRFWFPGDLPAAVLPPESPSAVRNSRSWTGFIFLAAGRLALPHWCSANSTVPQSLIHWLLPIAYSQHRA